MEWFVYVMRSNKNGDLYKGLTNCLKRRLEQHNEGRNPSSKANAPWKIIFFEKFMTRIEARNREKFLKSGEGREFLKSIIPL